MTDWSTLARPTAGSAVSLTGFFDPLKDDLDHLRDFTTRTAVTNNTGGSAQRGYVGVFSGTAANSLLATTTPGDSRMVGVVLAGIASGSAGPVANLGNVTQVLVQGSVGYLDRLDTSGTAGYAMAGTVNPFGRALTTSAGPGAGTIVALIAPSGGAAGAFSNLTVSGTAYIGGNTTLASGLSVAGTAYVGGATTLGSALAVAGTATHTAPVVLTSPANLGIGNATPTSPIDVTRTITDPSTGTGSIAGAITHLITADRNAVTNLGMIFTIDATTNVFRYGTLIAAQGRVNLTGDSSGGLTTALIGVRGQTTCDGGASVTTNQGGIFIGDNSGTGTHTAVQGVLGRARQSAAGVATAAAGVQGELNSQSTGGTITTGRHFYAPTPTVTSTAVITTWLGFDIEAGRNTASASSTTGGFNAYGGRITLPTQGGNTSGTNINRGLYITGNGGTAGGGGVVTNSAIYSDSTATSKILGAMSIGTNTAPATSALLDLVSTTGALLLPRMTTTQRDALTGVNGMLIYNSTLGKFQGYEAGAWTSLI